MFKIFSYFMCGRIQVYIVYSTFSLMGIHMRHKYTRSDAKSNVGMHEFAGSTNEGWVFMRGFISFYTGTAALSGVTQEIVPFMFAVSRLSLLFDAALMVKKDLIIYSLFIYHYLILWYLCIYIQNNSFIFTSIHFAWIKNEYTLCSFSSFWETRKDKTFLLVCTLRVNIRWFISYTWWYRVFRHAFLRLIHLFKFNQLWKFISDILWFIGFSSSNQPCIDSFTKRYWSYHCAICWANYYLFAWWLFIDEWILIVKLNAKAYVEIL